MFHILNISYLIIALLNVVPCFNNVVQYRICIYYAFVFNIIRVKMSFSCLILFKCQFQYRVFISFYLLFYFYFFFISNLILFYLNYSVNLGFKFPFFVSKFLRVSLSRPIYFLQAHCEPFYIQPNCLARWPAFLLHLHVLFPPLA